MSSLNFMKLNFRLALLFALMPMFVFSCGQSGDSENLNVLYTSLGGRLKTLDPVYASDINSGIAAFALYDRLLQYDYLKRPYELKCSMLEKMPEVSSDSMSYEFILRDELKFIDDLCFENNQDARKIKAGDVVFSLLRLADSRNNSPGFWLIRDKIKGLEKFRKITAQTPEGDFSPYDRKYEGFEIISDRKFIIHLKEPYPRLLYVLAMAYTSVVPREAVEYYSESFSENPVGSGPFKLLKWRRNYSITLLKNYKYRKEFFSESENPADKNKKLPYLDKVVCYLVKQHVSAWLLFLQGNLDLSSVDKNNFETVINKGSKLAPALKKRGIRMLKSPEFQINYIGFSLTDPLLADNLNLRKAISLAYNTENRIKFYNGKLKAANGPIPPGVPGHIKNFENPYTEYNIQKAKNYLEKAGFKNGINPETGKALELTFDLGNTSTTYQQLASLMVDDMRKIGIKIIPKLNNWPLFLQKNRSGKMQLFKVAWIGDYPDAQNFLQLFYGPNAGSSNRAFYRDEKFDEMYEKVELMKDCPERTEKYKEMFRYITEKCPWIFESYPVSFRLLHSWVQNYYPHNFVFCKWKYMNIDTKQRRKMKENFKALSMGELRTDKE